MALKYLKERNFKKVKNALDSGEVPDELFYHELIEIHRNESNKSQVTQELADIIKRIQSKTKYWYFIKQIFKDIFLYMYRYQPVFFYLLWLLIFIFIFKLILLFINTFRLFE